MTELLETTVSSVIEAGSTVDIELGLERWIGVELAKWMQNAS